MLVVAALAACSGSVGDGGGTGAGGASATNSSQGGTGVATSTSSGGATSAPGAGGAGGFPGQGGGQSGATAGASGGTISASGGAITASGGATTASGGATTASGGATTASGGATTASGGATTASGGTTPTGGARTGGAGATGAGAGGRGPGGTLGGGGATVTGGTGGTPASLVLPARSTILEAMQRANGWFMKQHPDPGASAPGGRGSTLWTRATYYEGLLALYAVEPDATARSGYKDYAVQWGTSHGWALYSTSAGTTTTNADNMACGQTYLDLYAMDKQASYIKEIKASVDAMVASPPTGTAAWWWIDAIQMAMPSFAKLGVLLGDSKYFDGMWAMYDDARTVQGGGLWNASEGLWFRDLHFTPGGGTKTPMTAAINSGGMPGNTTDAYYVSPNGKSLYWSRGNGWVLAALARVLDILPSGDAHRATYVADFTAMAKALLGVQRSDGFWNESLFDPSHCATIGLQGDDGPETSGTAFFVYGLAWGIRRGLLDPVAYGPAVQSGWNGLATVALQADGLLGYTQSTGDRPCTEDSANPGPLAATRLANFDDYGVGAFLLAGSEVYQLAR
jgi:unsaturated rhamnogalacturonyl hydrolase